MPQPPDDSFNSQLNHLASQMISKHQTDRALILLKIVLKTDPKNFPALSNLGTIFKRKDNYTKALSFYRQAALIEPNNPEIHYNLGQTYLKIGKFKLALKHLLSCRQFGGNYPGLNLNIAVCYEEVGQIKLAQTQYKHLLAHQPNYLPALSNLARLAQYTWQWDLITQLTPQLNATLRQELRRPQPVFEKPYTNLLRSNNKTLNLAVAKNHSTALKTSVSTSYFHSPNSTPPHSPLKLGYLSCDYGDHVMAYHTHPLFSLHNRRQFQVYAYAYGPPNHSQLRSQIQHDSDVWQDFSNQSAHSIAEKIYRDGIDILIDLAGHTGNSRFDILAHRPAPIQVHYLGFPGSTGADYIDYLFTDKILTPLSYQKYFSEKLIFLPGKRSGILLL
jgi:protein O-GlcNAc transferase